jgi:ferritin-like metal-binding protein YciE
MESMNDLKALFQHEIEDLVSAEDQIIAAMPAMIAKAQNPGLKKALEQHLEITQRQRERLDKVQELIKDNEEESKGLLSGILGIFQGGQTCKGMEGIIAEGQKIMAADMSSDVMDAAIIASAQKVEHYEICGYGTVKAYAEQLNLTEAARLLEETLDEEYEADDRLTALALGDVNEKAERAQKGNKKAAAKKSAGTAKKASKAAAPKKVPVKQAAQKNYFKSSSLVFFA